MSTIENLLYFYEENKGKIFIPNDKIGIHEINYHNIDEWIEAIKNATKSRICGAPDGKYTFKTNCDDSDTTKVYVLFAYFFKLFLRYITFTEMLDRMALVSGEIKTLVEENSYDYIIFYITGSLYKSNTWIALLYINKLLKLEFFTDEINPKIKIISRNNEIRDFINNNIEKKCLVLHFDDMSYSGWQVSGDIPNDVDLKNTDWYLCAAYVSSSAKKLFEMEKNFLKYFENTETIYSFQDSISKYFTKTTTNQIEVDQQIQTHIENNFNDVYDAFKKLMDLLNGRGNYYYGETAFGLRKQYIGVEGKFNVLDRTPVYFDHKLADNKSTFQKLMRSGSFPSDLNDCKFIPLIDGCGAEDVYGGKGCQDNDYLETDIPFESSCPKTFYKTITYSYNDNNIQIENTTWLDENKKWKDFRISEMLDIVEQNKPKERPERQEMKNTLGPVAMGQQEMEKRKNIYFFSRELFEKTYSNACGKLVMDILKTLCFNIIDAVKYSSNQHIDLEFKNTYAIGLLTSENNSELVIEGMTFLKKKGDGVQVTTKKKIEVSGNGTDEFLYIDLMCTKKGEGNGKLLFKAVESLASVEGMEKIVLYWAGNADSFWRHMGFVEESDDAKKYYSDGTTIYKDSGTRMEKPVPRESRQPYNIISNAGDLKELFVRIKNIFGNDLKCKDGKRGQIPENNEIGLDFKKVEGVMPVVLAVKKNKIQVALSVRKEPTNKKKFTFFPGNCFHKPSSKNVLKHLNKSFKKYVQERRLNTQMTQISIYLIILILLQ